MLPLGIDLGHSRLRVAACEANGGDVRLRAVAARDVPIGFGDDPEMVAASIEEMLEELGVRERRCIASLGPSEASFRLVTFPKMSWNERRQAARFESVRLDRAELESMSSVRVHPVDRSTRSYAIGAADQTALARCLRTIRSARLRPIAVDFDGCAFGRLREGADAVLDIGADRSALHVYGPKCVSYLADRGGNAVTQAIGQELAIDLQSAERRKRILGAAGIGNARETLVRALTAAIDRGKADASIASIALAGNGARVQGLAQDLQAATGIPTTLTVPRLLESSAYPEDVIRTAAPDWRLAAALATWSVPSYAL